MKRATVRDFRNQFARVSAWIEEGEPVEITRGRKVFARLLSATRSLRRFPKPDILARLKRTWGSGVFSAEEVAAMRAAESGGEGA
jgi:antitoxin (DNA-binding transcriptional repressor) of toxin-antitoxin stability system